MSLPDAEFAHIIAYTLQSCPPAVSMTSLARFAPVQMAGATDDQRHGLPFGNEAGDGGKAVVAGCGADDVMRTGSAGFQLAQCYPDARLSVVESEYGAAFGQADGRFRHGRQCR